MFSARGGAGIKGWEGVTVNVIFVPSHLHDILYLSFLVDLKALRLYGVVHLFPKDRSLSNGINISTRC